MTEWKTYRLGDLVKVKGGKRLPKGISLQIAPNTHPYIRIRDMGKSRVLELDATYEYVDDVIQKSIARYVVDEGDILLSIVGTIGLVGIVGKSLHQANQTENCVKLVSLNGIDPLFLYYFLLSPKGQEEIKRGTVGAVQAKLPIKNIENIEISLPPLAEQRRIAGILGAIDDKIENNRRINTNLELQAQALYKQWFVDNRKDDWEEKQLGEIALHITDGVHNTVIDSPNGEYYLLSCKNIKSGQLFIGSNERRIDHETFTKLRKRTRLSQGDILVTSVGTVGEMYLVNESPTNYEFQRSVAIIKPNQDIISSYFLYAALLYQRNEIKHLAHGAVQQCIFISDLKEYSLIVPNKDDISTFDAVVTPMFNKIGELQKENETLATLRDTLLPKLMNGEIKTE